jgi:hypothetical protein
LDFLGVVSNQTYVLYIQGTEIPGLKGDIKIMMLNINWWPEVVTSGGDHTGGGDQWW